MVPEGTLSGLYDIGIDILVKSSVPDNEQGERMIDLKGYRNIHIGDEIVHYDLGNHPDDFDDLFNAIRSY